MIICGDSLIELKNLESNSIDSCLTDPPYGLKFMNKNWDVQVPSVELWKEVFRVLKPGAHLLAFGGTRTYHRMVCNIEDAGFEIRDQVQWLYGSGFPKSLNISKAIDKAAGATRKIIGIAGKSGSKRGCMSGDFTGGEYAATDAATDAAKQWDGWGTALKPANEICVLARKPLTGTECMASLVLEICQHKLFANAVTRDLKLSHQEQNVDVFIAQWLAGKSTLTPDGLCALTAMLRSRWEKISNLSTELSWLNTLAVALQYESTFTTETELSLITDLKTLKYSLSKTMQKDMLQEGGHGEQLIASPVGSLFLALELKLNYILTPSAQGLATNEVGHLSLHPNSSPIVLARKPISEKTVAANVLKWGTGGLNIDECRVGTDDTRNIKKGGGGITFHGQIEKPRVSGSACGRFPANLILDEQAGEMLDIQVSRTMNMHAPGNKKKSSIKASPMFGIGDCGKRNPDTYKDSGGASRFFYCAKASKSERGKGNNHPTVKPIKLLSYLAKLITPPGGTLLDPFMGSGSTGIAANKFGFDFVGIEIDAAYFEIAKSRIENAI